MIKVKEHRCPTCNYLFDCVTGVKEDSIPKKGDVSICINCGELLYMLSASSCRVLLHSEFENFLNKHEREAQMILRIKELILIRHN